jgi:FK506-binding protein 1
MGVKVTVTKQGDGKNYPKDGDKLTVHYTGKLKSTGAKFDSSKDRGKLFEFVVGVGQVIKGWDEGVVMMSLGEIATLDVSADFGYGAAGAGVAIPPNADLVFEVELVAIEGKTHSSIAEGESETSPKARPKYSSKGPSRSASRRVSLHETYQVMDTPGLLGRTDDKRNLMEQLTLACMQHLHATVIYVVDASGNCGPKSPLGEQLRIREEVRERFMQVTEQADELVGAGGEGRARAWLDVVSKTDLEAVITKADFDHLVDAPPYEDGVSSPLPHLPQGALRVSVQTGEGVHILEAALVGMLDATHQTDHDTSKE